MADVPAAIARHLKDDATVIASIAAANIWPGPVAGACPQIYIRPVGGAEETVGTSKRVYALWIEHEQRGVIETVHGRIRQIFHEKTAYNIGTSPQVAQCILSKRISGPEIDKNDDNGAFAGVATYEFTTVEPHGF